MREAEEKEAEVKEMMAKMTGKILVMKVKKSQTKMKKNRKLSKNRNLKQTTLINSVILTCSLCNLQANIRRLKSFSFVNFATTQLSNLKNAKNAAKFTAQAALMIGKSKTLKSVQVGAKTQNMYPCNIG